MKPTLKSEIALVAVVLVLGLLAYVVGMLAWLVSVSASEDIGAVGAFQKADEMARFKGFAFAALLFAAGRLVILWWMYSPRRKGSE